MTGTRLQIVGLAGTLLASVVWTTPTMAAGTVRSVGALTTEAILTAKDRIRPLFTKMGAPKPGDWSESHQESGQTFDEYVRSCPTRPVGKRRVVYIQPIGHFTAKQRSVVNLTSDFMARYFDLGTLVLDALPLSVIPNRKKGSTKMANKFRCHERTKIHRTKKH
jgi:hypothetical protein